MAIILVSREAGDLEAVLLAEGVPCRRCGSAAEAAAAAGAGDGVLLLADGYPVARTPGLPELLAAGRQQGFRLFAEYPETVPGVALGETRTARWERTVVASEAFAPDLEKHRILMLHNCRYAPCAAPDGLLAIALVAGFYTAIYGLPPESERRPPILFVHPDGRALVATTQLSRFVTARYAPADAWRAVWRWILRWLCPSLTDLRLPWTPSVRPSWQPGDPLPPAAESEASTLGARWYGRARLLIHPSWQAEAQRRLETFPDGAGRGPEAGWPVGDGSCGMIEGASSTIHLDGSQDWRYHLRNDCMGEVSFALSLWAGTGAGEDLGEVAARLNDYIYFHSVFASGPRADPASPSYGLVSWTSQPPADGVYYGDDNARSLLGTLGAAAALGQTRWDAPVLRCLLANLRTTGPQGFRGGRLEEAQLQEHGWRHFWESARVHFAPHYEAWLWAALLWAYGRTGFAPFLERPRRALGMTMAAYPDQWRWTNGIQQERARMLLPLAWLVRVQDTEEHRGWLRTMAHELLRCQDPCGALREEIGRPGMGSYAPPATNEEYGTTEAPLIQRNGDPLCDLLYTTNFAFVGLHEAAAATGDPQLAAAADRLAAFLCRIQSRSETHPELDGAWFRAFDFRRWDYWGSNADLGWGAWSVESGWTQAWITSVLALRQRRTCFWDLTAGSRIGEHLEALRRAMLPGI